MTYRKRNIWGSAGLVTIMLFAFKIVGFIKQSVIAYYYGTTMSTDAYFAANTFISGVCEIIVVSLGIASLTAYVNCIGKNGETEGEKFINNAFSLSVWIGIAVVVVILVTAPTIATLFFGRADISSQLAFYIRCLSPIILFSFCEMIFATILDAHQCYFIPRLRSLVYSVSVIGCCVLFAESLKVGALVWGQYFSRIISTAVLLFFVLRYCKVHLSVPKINGDIKRLGCKAIPLLVGNGIIQLNRIVDQSIASRLSEGAGSSLSYSQVLEDFVVATIVTNVGGILFVDMADLIAHERKEEVSQLMHKQINIYFCVLMPISIITIFSAQEIVSVVYLRGAFNEQALKMTATALIGYAVAFPILGIRDIMMKGLYVYNDTLHAMMSSVISMGVNIILSITLSKVYGIFGITISTSISACLGMCITMFMLKRHMPICFFKNHWKVLVKNGLATGVLFLVIWLIRAMSINSALISFSITAISGLGIYYFMLFLMRVKEVDDVVNYMRLSLKRIRNFIDMK